MKLNCIRVYDEIAHDDPLSPTKRVVLTDAIIGMICDQVFSRTVNTVVIDGRPGIGKTTIVEGVEARLSRAGINYQVVGSDDDVMERPNRNGYSLLEFHPGGIVSEASRIHFDPNILNGGTGGIDFLKYNGKTGLQDLPTHYDVPGQNGVLIAEGVRSAEYVLQAVMNESSEIQRRVLFVFLDAPTEVINGRRFTRDVEVKGLSEEAVQNRIDTQEYDLAAHSRDVLGDFGLRGRVDVWNR